MKSTIKLLVLFALITALAFIAHTAHSQPKPITDTTKVKKETVPAPIPYKADPATVYHIDITEGKLTDVFTIARAGIIPYLKTTKTPMDQLDNATAYFNQVLTDIGIQYAKQWQADRDKFVADSVAKASPPSTKKKQ